MYKLLIIFLFICLLKADYLDSIKALESSGETSAQNAQNNAYKLTIKEAYDDAMANNDGLKAQKLGVDVAKKLELGAKLSYLPQIDINALYLHLGEKIQLDMTSHLTADERQQLSSANANCIANPPATAQLQQICSIISAINTPITLMERNAVAGVLNILYPLYSGGARYYGNKLASIALKDSKEALRLKELATFEEIIDLYYSLLLSAESVETLKANRNGAQKHYENNQKLYKLGQIAELELINSKMALDRAENKLLAAQNVYEIAQLAFNSAVHLSSEYSYTQPISHLEISKDMNLKPENYYVEATLSQYPALKIAKNKVDSAKFQHRLDFGSFMPKIAAFGTFMVTDNQSKMEQMMPNWYLGISARWSLVSPQARFPKYQASKILHLQAAALESQALRDIELLVKKTYRQLVFYIQEVSSLDSSIALARENLKLQQKAYTQGMATNTQVIDARNALLDAILEQKVSVYKVITTYAKLQALSGDTQHFFRVYR